MNYITTTELRTKSPELVKILREGGSVSLIHRSEVIGEIKPAQEKEIRITNIQAFKKFLRSIRAKKLIPKKDRKKIYRQHLREKYGQDFP